MVPLEIIARQLEFVERTRIEGLPLDFSKLANENIFKVHKIIQETQLQNQTWRAAWLLSNNSL